jgi:hypothetical protein
MADLKLNQLIALEKGAKATGEGALTKLYHEVQKTGPMSGISRTYKPLDDEGDQLPSEATKLQLRVKELLRGTAEPVGRLLDLTATKDAGNQIATANVVVDGVTVLSYVPVTTLLALEKKLVDFANVISKLPTLDPAEEWTWDDATNSYRTPVTETVRTKKTPRNHVLAQATDKHPAQVQMYNEDVIVGRWSTTKYSGAILETERLALAGKVARLAAAVKVAREEANVTTVPDVKIGAAIFEYLGW